MEIRQIRAAETYPLRRDVLRPNTRIEDQVYMGDEAVDTLHLGAFENGRLVGVASVFRESPAGLVADAEVWRLRGMATLPEVRGKHYGVRMLNACLRYVAEQGGRKVWCNAGITASGFFEAFGFQVEGGLHALAGRGASYFLERPITDTDLTLS